MPFKRETRHVHRPEDFRVHFVRTRARHTITVNPSYDIFKTLAVAPLEIRSGELTITFTYRMRSLPEVRQSGHGRIEA